MEREGLVVHALLGDAEHVAAEVVAEGVAVEGEADLEGPGEVRLDLFDRLLGEALSLQRFMVDAGGVRQRLVAGGVGDDLLDLRLVVAEPTTAPAPSLY